MAGNFNLDNYETVKERKKRFYQDNPNGSIVPIIASPMEQLMDYVLFKVEIRRDSSKESPDSIGFALEIRDKEKKLNKWGKEYESVNYTSWVENCEESAVGRALDNLGYAGNDKCSREEIEKVKRNKEAIDTEKKSVGLSQKKSSGQKFRKNTEKSQVSEDII